MYHATLHTSRSPSFVMLRTSFIYPLFNNIATFSAGNRTGGKARAFADGIHYGKCTNFDPVCERAYARLHTDTRECARAITYEAPGVPPPGRSLAPIQALYEYTHNYRQEGAIINLGITPQTYMPRRVPSRDIPRRGEGFRFLGSLPLTTRKKVAERINLIARFTSRLREILYCVVRDVPM